VQRGRETGDDREEQSVKVHTDAGGSFNIDLKLKPTTFGACTITADFRDAGDESSQNTFKEGFHVAEYQPNAFEVRLLLAQDFGEQFEWAMNWFFEKENTGDRGGKQYSAQDVDAPARSD